MGTQQNFHDVLYILPVLPNQVSCLIVSCAFSLQIKKTLFLIALVFLNNLLVVVQAITSEDLIILKLNIFLAYKQVAF